MSRPLLVVNLGQKIRNRGMIYEEEFKDALSQRAFKRWLATKDGNDEEEDEEEGDDVSIDQIDESDVTVIIDNSQDRSGTPLNELHTNKQRAMIMNHPLWLQELQNRYDQKARKKDEIAAKKEKAEKKKEEKAEKKKAKGEERALLLKKAADEADKIKFVFEDQDSGRDSSTSRPIKRQKKK